MSQRVLLVLSVAVLISGAFAGCFGDDKAAAKTNGIPGSELPPLDVSLFLHQIMFHPYPGGMLTAWAFSEEATAPDDMRFDPPVIRAKEGQTVRIQFTNMDPNGLNHTIHWHGLDVPWEMDGVPYLTQDPILEGETFLYEFEAKPAGTHMFHCHVDAHHHTDMGMYGIFIVEPNEPDKYEFDSEAEPMIFDDWDSSHLHQTNNDPQMTVDSTQDPSGDPFNQIDRTTGQVRETYNNPNYPVIKDVYSNPTRESRYWYPETHPPWQPNYDTYTINGKSFPWTDNIVIKEGETKKLRLLNIANSPVSFHLHGHHFQVTHTDGHPLPYPWVKDTLLIGPGERYDILVEGNNPGIWMAHDHIGGHGSNNHISPGGAMTHLVYESFLERLEGGGDHDHSKSRIGQRVTAGDFLGLYR